MFGRFDCEARPPNGLESPTMNEQNRRVGAVFDDWARQGRAEGMARRHGPVVNRALERISLPDDGWFLDVGCGNGYVVRWAAEHVPNGKAYGVDISEEMIARCRATPELGNVTFLQGTFPDIGLPCARFDVAMDLRSEQQWVEAFTEAGFEAVEQARITIPADETNEPSRINIGSLLTSGCRPA